MKKFIKRKISKGLKNAYLKGSRIPWNKGIPRSDDTKKKISRALKGNKNSLGFKHTEIFKKARRDYCHTEIAKSKIGDANKGQIPWNKGKLLPEGTKMKMSISHIGKNNPNWQGGISFEPYPINWIDLLKESIRQRDNYICQMCGIHQNELKGRLRQLDIHHIDYNKNNCDPINLITLCRKCHMKTNYNRNYWKNCFIKNKKGGKK